MFVLYRPDSEFARVTEEFVANFDRQHEALAAETETVNVDSRDGGALARLYDVVQHPAVVVVREDGQLMKLWQGMPLPMMDEVVGFLR